MTVFDLIKDILHTKEKNCFSSIDDEKQFSPYIVNRWISMYNKSIIQHCDIINRYLSVFENKRDSYNFFSAVFPKVPHKQINYIKKKKNEDTTDDMYKKIAKNLELSTREIKTYVDLLKK